MRIFRSAASVGICSMLCALFVSTASAITPITPPTENEGKVTVRLAAARTEVLPGDQVQLTLDITNHDRRTQHGVIVSLTAEEGIDLPNTLPQNGTFANPKTASWTIDQIFAGKVHSISLPVSVRSDVQQGKTMTLTTRVAGADVNPDTSTLSSQVTLGAAVLPKTGFSTAIFAAVVMLVTAGLLTAVVRRVSAR